VVQVAPGMMVTANVRLERPLGEGAMGAVWVAEHLTLKTQVAVKFISAQLAADPNVLARFTQEASVAAQIKSPHVVQTFDQGLMRDGTPYIVMELLEGESLQERLERVGRLSLADAAMVVSQVARALNRAHDLGIVHRDIKPDNIFITPGDDGMLCKILDFGIAKQTSLPKLGGLTSAGMMVGTPEFMSPEQVLSAKDVDYRADLWGLAVTTYFVLTDELPFTAEALGTLCVKLLDGKFTPATELRPDLPKDLDVWFNKSMAHEPDDRFTSAREMADVFVRIVAATGAVVPSAPLSGLTPAAGLAPYGTARSAIDTTAPLPSIDKTEALPPGMLGLEALGLDEAELAPAEPRHAPSQTLTGSAANRRREEGSSKWVVALAAGVLLTLGVVAMFAAGDDDSSPAAPVGTTELATAPTSEPTSKTTSEPTAEPTIEPTTEPSASSSVGKVAAPGPPKSGPATPPVAKPPNTTGKKKSDWGF
jgi:eukaryotic-like serine/threonine-protein kinase